MLRAASIVTDCEQVVLDMTDRLLYSPPYVVCAGGDIAGARNNRSSGRGFVGRRGGGGMFQVQSCAARGRWLKRERAKSSNSVSRCKCECGCGRPLSGILPPPSTCWPAGPASDRLGTGMSPGGRKDRKRGSRCTAEEEKEGRHEGLSRALAYPPALAHSNALQTVVPHPFLTPQVSQGSQATR